jgi:hypothetical protein
MNASLLIPTFLVLLVAACSRRSDPEPAGHAPPSTATAAEDGDDLVIEKLRESGTDLRKPLAVDVYLYFPSEAAANSVADSMRGSGYSAEVRAPRKDVPDWACVAKKPMLVTSAGMHDVRAKLTALASQFGGEYDGWEAPVAR